MEVYLAVKFPPKPVIYTQESTFQPCNQSWNQNISFVTERNLLSSPQLVILRANATDLEAGCQSDQRWNMGQLIHCLGTSPQEVLLIYAVQERRITAIKYVYDKQLHYHHQECHTDVRQARVGEISQQRIRTKGIMMYYRKLSTP